LKTKYQGLLDIIKKNRQVAVAFSGGVDSTLLLKAAIDVFGPGVIAFHVHTALQKPRVAERVSGICQLFGCSLHIVELDPLSWPEFVDNNPDRCYFCKKRIYAHLTSLLPPGCALLDGTNIDDLGQDRPGLNAIRELHVQMPLVEAGFLKNEIRAVCRELSLANWDQPSESCLATRIIHGVRITPELLRDVQAGEHFLEEKGFSACRVRLNGESAFVSFSQGDNDRILAKVQRDEVVNFFAKLNYSKVFLELSERAAILINNV
jgi:pyridinium-3,5-biscarboxylic acid mononucleotide sulfurtransferase